jgi:sigma-B regulation protein RsbU (phosphoserine phosphatase)
MDDWHVGIVTGKLEEERRLANDMSRVVAGMLAVRIVPRAEVLPGSRWVAAIRPSADLEVFQAARSARDAGAKAVYLIQAEGDGMPEALENGFVDDVLILPLRPLELLSRLSHAELLCRMEEVTSMNASVSGLVDGFRADLEIVEKLHRAKQPRRFGSTKGFRVESRYLTGNRSGGDHFDVIDAPDSSQLSLMLSDSSSYGLSSAVLSALMHIGMKFSADTTRAADEVVRMLFEDVQQTLKDRDKLSVFYGIVNRKDYTLRYTHLGSTGIFHSADGKSFQCVQAHGGALAKGAQARGESQLKLQPKDRLALISDGFIEAVGGDQALRRILDEFRQKDSRDLLNELVFRVKSQLPGPEDLPEQDCTALLLDVDSRLIRLAG